MSHIIGKVYEVNQVNMNKLIAELEKLQAENQSHSDKCCKMALENNDLNFDLIKLQKQNEIMREAFGKLIDESANLRDRFFQQDYGDLYVKCFDMDLNKAREALAKIEKDEG